MNNEIAQEILTWIAGAREILAEQAPLLVQEIVMWGMWGNLSIALLLLALIGVSFACRPDRKLIAWKQRLAAEPYPDTVPAIAAIAVLWLTRALVLFLACTCLYWALCAAVTPRYYLLVKLAKLAGAP